MKAFPDHHRGTEYTERTASFLFTFSFFSVPLCPLCLCGENPSPIASHDPNQSTPFRARPMVLAALAVAGTSTSAAVAQKAPAAAQSAPIQSALRGHVRLHHRRDAHAPGGDDVRRRGAGAGAALAPGVDARRVRDLELRALGLRLHATPGDRALAGTSSTTTRGASARTARSRSRVRFDYLADSLDNAMAWAAAELRVLQRHERLPLSRGTVRSTSPRRSR